MAQQRRSTQGAGSLQGSLSVGVFGVQDSAISCVQRFMQANRRDARHARRPSTLDHGPRPCASSTWCSIPKGPRSGALPAFPTHATAYGWQSLPPTPWPAVGIADLVQFRGRPLRFHEHHGRRVRAKLPALRRKRLYALGARSDEQRHGSATAHRRWTGSRVRRRPKPLAGASVRPRQNGTTFAFRQSEGACHALPARRFPLCSTAGRGTGEAKAATGHSRRVRSRIPSPLRRGRLSRCHGASSGVRLHRTAQRRARANPLLRLSTLSTCSLPLPANSSLSCCSTSPCPTTTAWPFASRATEPAAAVDALAGITNASRDARHAVCVTKRARAHAASRDARSAVRYAARGGGSCGRGRGTLYAARASCASLIYNYHQYSYIHLCCLHNIDIIRIIVFENNIVQPLPKTRRAPLARKERVP